MMVRIAMANAATLVAVLGTAPALADAWGAALGRVDGGVTPGGANSEVIWNPLAQDWLLHSEAEVHHYGPAHTMDYDADGELLDPAGDGVVGAGPVATGDLASVTWVEAAVASAGGPYVDLSAPDNVYSYAADPATMSDAAGLGQHDNCFWVVWTGDPGQQPASVMVDFNLVGSWNLSGDSEDGDDWWADLLAVGEVYDGAGTQLGFDSEYHVLSGPGELSAGGDLGFGFSATLAYDTPYSFNFWLSAESHAVSVPEPAALMILVVGCCLWRRRRR